MEHTVLYRYFDETDRLLYVGITKSQRNRLQAHSKAAEWFPMIVRATFEHFETRESALEAERNAIRWENPVYNIAGRPITADSIYRIPDHLNMMLLVPAMADDKHGEFIDDVERYRTQIRGLNLPENTLSRDEEKALACYFAIGDYDYSNLVSCHWCKAFFESDIFRSLVIGSQYFDLELQKKVQ